CARRGGLQAGTAAERNDPPAGARRLRPQIAGADRLGRTRRCRAPVTVWTHVRTAERGTDHRRAFRRDRNLRGRRRRRGDRRRHPQRHRRDRARPGRDRSRTGADVEPHPAAGRPAAPDFELPARGGCVLTGLQCHLCKATFPAAATYVCDKCLGPLEPVYDYDAIALTRDAIERRPKNLWRYRELLPITGEPRTGFNSGFTPLVRCDRLARRLGVSELYIKDDSVNHPTLSYKDRVVSVAATRAAELGFDVLACASTGNL